MKVLIFSRESHNLGGVVNFLNSLKSKLKPSIEVTDFVIGYRKNSKNAVLNVLQPLRDGLNLFAHMLTHRYDAIHINPSLQFKSVLRDGFFLAILKLMRKDQVLVFFHGWDKKFFQRIEKNRLYSSAFRRVFSCRKILVLAAEVHDDLVSLGFDRKNIEVMTTMFDGDLFASSRRASTTDRFQILFLSRLIVEKGSNELLDAFAELAAGNDNLHLVMAGDGPELETLTAKVEDRNLQHRVHLPGYIRDKVKVDVMLNSHLFVLPSYSEGCPVSLLEAMAAGLPVIGSRVGAVPEIVVNKKNGIIMDSVSKDEIVKALRYCIAHPDFVSSAGENNHNQAWQYYEASIVTKRIEKIYEEIASG